MKMTNQQKAQIYHNAVSEYDTATVEAMIREDYIQHNPRVPTGRAAFLALFPTLKAHRTRIENIRIFEDGDHVIMHHLWQNAAPFGADQKVAFHIIRFDHEGLIAEHWSVMTDVTPPNLSGRSQFDGPREIENLGETALNKVRVTELFGVLTKPKAEDLEQVIAAFFLPGYRQHHPEIGDGMRARDLRYTRQHRVFGSGNFVLSISEGTSGGKPTAFYDLFRLEKGLIAEHWNVSQEIPTSGLANDNTMFHF